MSLKTDEIKKALKNLEEANKELELFQKENPNQKLDDICFNFSTNLRNLKTWIDLLYKYNGRSTSNKKVSASRENGKKGGRPPKEIANLRKRIYELENILLPELQDKINNCLEEEEATNLAAEKTSFEIELSELQNKFSEYTRIKIENSSSNAISFLQR